MEPLRRRALIDAAIGAIGERGSLDVTMSDIAGRAGVSSALAHHYFGAKEDLLEATMRHILAELGRDSREALRGSAGGIDRVRAVIGVNFSQAQFRAEIVAAWLAFYVAAQRSMRLRRLLHIYARRLNSNLLSGLGGAVADPVQVASGIAALIDGLYIRQALKEGAADAGAAAALVEDYLILHVKEHASTP
jgi:TetR/AcrR family transcriptional repressor of bet genes